MVKNLDTKEIWKFSKSFVKREGILLLACVLAVASSLAVVPKAEYIDWRVLVLLYCLMLVVGGFKSVAYLITVPYGFCRDVFRCVR